MAAISHTAISPVREARCPQILFSDEGGIYWLRGDNLTRAKKLLQLSPDQKNVGFDGHIAHILIDELNEKGVTVGIIRGNTMRTIGRQQTRKPEKIEHRTVWLEPTLIFDESELCDLKRRLTSNGSAVKELVETMRTQFRHGNPIEELGRLYVYQVAENIYEVDELTTIPEATIKALALAAYETGSLLCCELIDPKSKRNNGHRQKAASIPTPQFVVSEPVAYGQLRFEI